MKTKHKNEVRKVQLKKLYIDVTQSVAWTGKVTGIIRVMDELSIRFVNDKKFDVIFIFWHANTATFYSTNYKEILRERDYLENDKVSTASKKFLPISKTKRLMRAVYKRLQLSITMSRSVSFLNGKMMKHFMPGKDVQIEKDSLLFMPHGGVWESETYIANILELRSKKNVKLITVVHDLCPVLTPQFVTVGISKVFANYMKKVLPKSDLVLAVSNNTAKDVQFWLKSFGMTSIPPISVFREGDEIGEGQPEKPKYVKIPDKFILCVGTVEARKNHTSLYYAYKLAAEQGKQLPPILVVGRKGWMAENIYEIITRDPEIKDKLIFLHTINDNELVWLYQNAMFTVYPSFYEGWGLPIAESLLRGTPCIASSTSSMKEIAGDLIDYFSPYSVDELLQKMILFSSDHRFLKNRRAQIIRQYKPTTWDSTYEEISQVLNEL